MQNYRYINLTKFKKLFVRTICYVHVVTRIVTRILSDTLISANLARVACKFSYRQTTPTRKTEAKLN